MRYRIPRLLTHDGHSFFSYPLTRNYPFSWFTPAAIVLGIVATILFSLLNLATNGYELVTRYTNDYNGTVKHTAWFEKAPFTLFNKIEPSCQPLQLTQGSQYFTSNYGYQYTLDNVWLNSTLNTRAAQPAVAYSNSPLLNCSVPSISLELRRPSSKPFHGGLWLDWSDTYASATATCMISASPHGLYFANFTLKLPTVLNAAGSKFLNVPLQTNASSRSLWWGTNLLNVYYVQAATAASAMNQTDGSTLEAMSVPLIRNPAVDDFKSMAFFLTQPVVYTSKSTYDIKTWDWQTLQQWDDADTPGLNISTSIDVFSKALYSTILTDLGQSPEGNALLTDDGISYLTNYTALADIPYTHGGIGPGFAGFEAPEGEGALGVEPTTIFGQYICSVPKRKGAGSLIVSILVADLVFLQAVWMLFNWAVQLYLEMKDPSMNQCASCFAREEPASTKGYQLVSAPQKPSPQIAETTMDDDASGSYRSRH